ncbi:MAG: 3-isopropylmalate dehydratase small subunit [Actinomycetota bacterium]
MSALEGVAHVYGDNVDTDVIIPARYLTSTEPEELAKHCMEDLDPGFVERVRPGDVIVGGRNFGSGSSREHAPLSIKGAGVACIVAESFARIFYRNSINVGLPIVECPGVAKHAEPGDRFRVDLDAGRVENVTRGEAYEATAMPEFMRGILDAGGLMPWVRRQLDTDGDARVAVAANEPVQADWRLD